MPRRKKIKRGTYASVLYDNGKKPDAGDCAIVLDQVDKDHYTVLLASTYEIVTVEAKFTRPHPAGAALIDAGDTKIDNRPEPDKSHDHEYKFRVNNAGDMCLIANDEKVDTTHPTGLARYDGESQGILTFEPVPIRQLELLAFFGKRHEAEKARQARRREVRAGQHRRMNK